MGVQRFRDQPVFDGRAFLGDFKICVAMCAFEVVMQIGEQGLGGGVVEADFFGEQERAAREHS